MMKNKKLMGAVAIACMLCVLLNPVTFNAKAAVKQYKHIRISGQDRFQTALEIAKNYCDTDTLDNVVIATGSDFPDALAGSVLAAKLNAPILLVNNDEETHMSAEDYISKHLKKGGNIYILGGNGVVPNSIANNLKSVGYNVTRYGGANREETAKLIDDSLNSSKGTPVVIATENDFPDALSISSVAGKNKYPILLSTKDSLPQYAKDYIKQIQPQIVYIIGGSGVLSDNIINQINAIPNNSYVIKVVRIGGKNRFETSLNVAKSFDADSTNAVIATGMDFPDALTGSTIAVKNNAPILLVDNNDLTSLKQSIDYSNINSLTFLGGYGVVRSATENALISSSGSNPQPQQKVVYQPDIPIPPTKEYMDAHSVVAPAAYCVGNSLSAYKIPFDGKWYCSAVKINSDTYIYDYCKILSEDTDASGKIVRETYNVEYCNENLTICNTGYTKPIN